MNCFIQLEKIELKLAEIALKANFITDWKHSVTHSKNILLYKSKVEFYTEPYIFRIKNKRNRSYLARLEIEIGR